MIEISLCMIVKNEEAVLARCLDSLQEVVDEIIIVDTGSTDNTKQIAKRYTDKVYDFSWCDDFSAARNETLRYATKDYIYIADADEVLDEENRRRFLQLKQVLLPEIDIVQMKYCNQLEYGSVYNFDEEYRPKLFKRRRELYFIDPIHETLQVEPVVYDSEIAILHRPHESHAKRDFKAFQMAISRGQRLSKRILNMYAKELLIAGEEEDFLACYDYFSTVMLDTTRDGEELKEAAIILARGARIQNQVVAFFKYCLKNVVMTPCSEICYELGEFYFSQGDYEEAIIWFYNAVYETESILSVKYQGAMSLLRLADCYEQLGEVALSTEYREKASERG